jgi:hypothetical protein
MDFSLLHMWTQMGMVAKCVVVILLIMSIYSITVSVERFFRFRKGKSQSAGYIMVVQQTLATRGGLQGLIGVGQRWVGSPVAKVIDGGLNEYVRGINELGHKVQDPAEVELLVDGIGRSMDRGKEREIANMKRGLSALATISSSAPFVAVRYGLRHHHRLPEHGRSQQGRRRSGHGVGRYLRGVADHRRRSGGRHRVGVVLQLLQRPGGRADHRRRRDRRRDAGHHGT